MAEKTKNEKKTDSSKKNKNKHKGISFTAIVILMLVVYLIVNLISARVNKLVTETAQLVTISDTISTTGVAVRNETVITSDVYGVTASVVENGGKVYKGEAIVNVFSSEKNAQAYRRIAEIDEALAQLNSMGNAREDNANEISSLEKLLKNDLYSFSNSVHCGDVSQAIGYSEDILYLMNKSQIATKQVDNFNVKINELQAERENLLSTCGETPQSLKSPLSGYYISEVDGYEGLLCTDILDGLTPEKFDMIMEQQAEIFDSSVIGKIADDYVWNIVCTVPAEKTEGLTEGSYYTIFLPYSDAESIEARLISITPNADETQQLLVFRCTYMVSSLASFRSQPIVIQKNCFKGLGVSLSAIVWQEESTEVSQSDGLIIQTENVPGVYILWGNEVKFRKIKELYRDGDTVICSASPESRFLKMYDEVIINNDKIYEGKIINDS